MFISSRLVSRRRLSTAVAVILLFLLGQTAARAAGEIDPAFNASAYKQPGGAVQTVVTQPDGKVLIGGNFEIVSGVFRGGLLRLNTDGSVDASFNPPSFLMTNGTIFINAIGLQSNGKIIVAGQFSQINGFFVSAPIVRLNTDGSLDTSFNLGTLQGLFQGSINDLDIRPDDKILIAGAFSYTTQSGGVTRDNLARLNPNGSTDTTFTPSGFNPQIIDDIAVQPDGKILGFNETDAGESRYLRRLNPDGTQDSLFGNIWVSGRVLAIKIQADGKILIGGNFTTVNNFPPGGIARLNADGTLDQTFISSSTPVTVYDIEFASDGKILVAGTFLNYSGVQRNLIARLNLNGTLDDSFNFNRNVNGVIYSALYDIAPLPNGQIVIGGDSFRLGNVGASVNRINSDGTVDNSFRSLLFGNRGTVVDIAPLSNGQTVISGVFGAVNTIIRPSVAKLNADGSPDTTFNPTIMGVNQDPLVLALAAQPDDKILVGGQFLGMLVRLNPDGSTDTTFNTSLATSGPVYDIAVLPDGKVIGAGQLVPQSGGTRYLMKFNQDGSVDNSFVFSGFSGTIIRKVVAQPDGKILIGGSFSSIGGFARNSIARLNADGSLDTSFNPLGGTNGGVLSLDLQADGKVLIGGLFTTVNGQSKPFIARLNADGSLDTTFEAAAGSSVLTIKVQPGDGKILVGGSFTNIGGAPRNRIARLHQNGSVDLTFNVGTGADGNVNAIAQDTSGKVLAGGAFVRFNNTPKFSIVRLLNDAAPRATLFDYDGDGKSDLSVFRPLSGVWYIARPLGAPSQSFDAVQFGANGDVIVPADYDGDGKTDVAVWRPSDGVWYVMQSSAGFRAAQFGASGDIPVPGDFDGDGKANLAVFRPSTGSWYIARAIGVPTQNFDSVRFGANGDKPIAGADFDGDGKADVAVFRPSEGNWYRLNSSNGQFVGVHFGIAEDKPIAADYDGDGKTDLAVFRPSDGVWYRINSGTNTFATVQFGISQDRPSPADYDGDGKTDFAVFRPSEGIWYVLRSTLGFTAAQFGTNGDIPTPNAFVY
ncbi:MAG TPA: FG-GAP-like repeat-containing protein [Pyrinomonadaceae bacterium]|jgi:uncharacterized delta-60 repeat protein